MACEDDPGVVSLSQGDDEETDGGADDDDEDSRSDGDGGAEPSGDDDDDDDDDGDGDDDDDDDPVTSPSDAGSGDGTEPEPAPDDDDTDPSAEVCGDGELGGSEDCDDGNTTNGDGCDALCRVEAGPGCGNGVLETGEGEECDDGNLTAGDGCAENCTIETTSSCGDGEVSSGEECDDGNAVSGDGCTAECLVEAGCRVADDAQVTSYELPIVYRDFYGVGNATSPDGGNPLGHQDFENETFSLNVAMYTVTASNGLTFSDVGGPTLGLVNVLLGDGASGELGAKPTFASTGPYQLTSEALFHQWYVDTPEVNSRVDEVIVMSRSGTGFAFSSQAFYPLDDRGLVTSTSSPGPEPERPVDWLGYGCGERQSDGSWLDIASTQTHNYSFTSELRLLFQYQGGENVVFRGDDDAWLFINGRLVIDLGGVHEQFLGDLCGNRWSVIQATPSCAGLGPSSVDVQGNPLDLVVGEVYELALFHAERHTCSSNYALSLTNFARMVGEDCAGE